MALTDFSDLYGSFHEQGFNRVIGHVMAKRPSLFNYGTLRVSQEWERLLCCRPNVAPEVLAHGNPVVTLEPPLSIPGTGGAYGLNWAMQIADLAIDFHPTDRELPPELGGKLAQQQLSVFARICGGIGCPSRRIYEMYPPAPQDPLAITGAENRPTHVAALAQQRDTITLPTEELMCFELDLYATARAGVIGPEGTQVLDLVVDGVEIVDIEPEGLENSLECYIEALLRYVVMPKLRILLPVFVFNLPLGLGSVTIRAAVTPPHNPAVEDDQLKVFADMEVGP